MTREEKHALVDTLSGKLANIDYFYIADTSDMTVAQVSEFRGMCFNAGLEYQIVKNTLIAKALERLESEADYTEFNNTVLKGTSGIIFSPEAANAPAKVLKEFKKKTKWEKTMLKAASIDSALFIGAEHLETLSNLKSKNELIGDVVGLLQAPINNVLGSLQSGGQTLSGLLKALEERDAA